jgi:SRSO17 transposase
MDDGDFGRVARTFRAFHRAFAPLFGRTEARRRSGQYLRGLLVQQTDRRNAENLAEAVAGATPRALQRFLTDAPWRHEPVLAALQGYLGDRLPPRAPAEGLAADGVWIVDDTGFAKQGTHSVGVARQYSGTLGKVGNCQLGVFLGYATARGHALVDARLYLPRAWTDDPARCRRAGVPEDVLAAGYQSKAELALAQLRRARAGGALVGRWVTADEAYGQVPAFRDALDAEGYWYVVEVPATTPAFPKPARTTTVRLGPGAPRRRVEVAPAAQTVQALGAALPARRWTRRTVADGAQGPRTHEFATLRVWESRDGAPGRATWLLLRRNPDGSELKYHLSNAPPTTSPRALARVSARRWPVETEFQQGKGEAGLDEYEVRSWRGWHHHVTLALLASAFLLTLQQDWGEKGLRGRAAGHGLSGDAPPGQPGAARTAAPPALDPRRPAPLAARHPVPQRPRESLPRQTPAAHAA